MTELERRIELIARLYLHDPDASHFMSKVRDVLSVPPGMGWRPMHTAPTTGSGEKPIRILVRVPGHGVRFGRVIQEGEHRIEFVDQMSGVEPDGWMPLPDMAHGYTFEDAPEEWEGHRARERIQELCAQVERLREDIYSQVLTVHGEFACGEPVEEFLPDSYNETPAQSLREIRAEAVDKFGREYTLGTSNMMFIEAAKEYAQQIREGKE